MWQLDEKSKRPIYQQIMEQIISYIQNGQLHPGDRLPAERTLATYYGVNRSTLVHALAELTALGWLDRKRGSGTVVSEGKWGRSGTPRVDWRRHFQREFQHHEPFLTKMHELPIAMDLYSGELPLDLIPDFQLPAYTWEELLLEEKKQGLHGYQPLLELICQRLKQEEGLELSTDQILITAGAQQALFLLLQVMLQAGDSVAIEDPSFLYSLPIFEAADISLYGVPMDEAGIELAALEQMIVSKKLKLLILNPTFQNPTGKTMAKKRREQLLALCQKYQLPVVEDDVFSELRFGSVPPALKKTAPHQVIYLGSLSKLFGSSIKIGWIVADPELIRRLAEAKQTLDFSISVFPQVVAHTALFDPAFEKKRAVLVTELKKRATAFTQAMQPFLSAWEYEPIEGGLYAWLTFRTKKLTRKDWQLFLDRHIAIAPAFLFSEATQAMRINYTRLEAKERQQFFAVLAEITKILGGPLDEK